MLPQPWRRLKLGIGMNGTKRWRTMGALLVLAAAAVSPANAAELKIFGSRVTKVIVGELGMQFEKVTGYTPVVVADVAAVMKRRIEAGEPLIGPDPHHAVERFGERAHAQRLARCGQFCRQRNMRDIEIGGRQAVEAARGSDQRVSVAKVDDAGDGIVRERICLRG